MAGLNQLELSSLYRMVRLIRRFEERAIQLVRSGEIVGGIHPYIGQEAIAAGVCAVLRPVDVITSTHRGHGHVLAKGADPGRLFAELAGRSTGLNGGRGGSMHAADFGLGIYGANAIVGASGAIATGAVWALRRQGGDQVGACFFGDGAMNEGALLEALNLAALWHVPVLFVCENNGYATTMPVDGAVAGSIDGRAAAFGIPVLRSDGQDVLAVRQAADEALELARAAPGPVFLECATYRFDAHHTYEHTVRIDYRSAEEIARGRSRDPVSIAGARLADERRLAIDDEVERTLDAAIEFALGSPYPDPAGALDHLYATGFKPRLRDGSR